MREDILHFVKEFPHSITNNSLKDKILIHLKDKISDEELTHLLNEHNFIRSKESFISSYEEQLLLRPNIVDHIEYLKQIKQPEQRTKEWYDFRFNHLTASNAWKAYSTKEKVKNQLIYEKCIPKEHYISGLTETPMSWGNKYEPLTIRFYEMKNNTNISEFGCIEHQSHSFLAASPDGIVTGPNNFGRMIEVKNVVSRVITGIPKEDYYIQMQLQMEVCDLNECDFVETKFIEYDSYNDYIEDGSGCFTQDEKYKGIIKVYIKNNKQYVYDYMDIHCTNIEDWLDNENTEYENTDYEWFKNIYWKLEVYSCVYVPRCKFWFDHTFQEIKTLWDTILEERENGEYNKRKPTKRAKKEIINLNTCQIQMNLI